jgi:hypothetical protein
MGAIDDVLASVKSSGANVTADVRANRIVLRGVTTLEITCERASTFRVREDSTRAHSLLL